MKKWMIAIVLCTAATALGRAMPFERNDVAQLVPVEALVVSVQEGQVVLDGGDCRGYGNTWETAWKDLQHGAEGKAFLSTAEHIVLCGAAAELLPKAVWSEALRPAAEICTSLGQIPDPKEAAKYLQAHTTGVTLNQMRAALLREETMQLPILVETKGGLRLYGT